METNVLSQKLIEVFEEDIEGAFKWLERPNRAFDGLTPLEQVEKDEGVDTVITVLAQMEHGTIT